MKRIKPSKPRFCINTHEAMRALDKLRKRHKHIAQIARELSEVMGRPVSRFQVRTWIAGTRPVPAPCAIAIQVMTKGKIKAKHLRSDCHG